MRSHEQEYGREEADGLTECCPHGTPCMCECKQCDNVTVANTPSSNTSAVIEAETAKLREALDEVLILVSDCPLCGKEHEKDGHEPDCKIGIALAASAQKAGQQPPVFPCQQCSHTVEWTGIKYRCSHCRREIPSAEADACLAAQKAGQQ